MRDPWFALFYIVAVTFLLVEITSELIRPSQRSSLPRVLRYGMVDRQETRLLRPVSIATAAVLLGLGEVVVFLFLFHKDSVALVRIIALGQIVVATLWLSFLLRLERGSTRRQ